METATDRNQASEFFMGLYQHLFERALTNAVGDKQRWDDRVKTFLTLGLLDFQSASTLKPRPLFDEFVEDEHGERIYVFPDSQLDEPNWRRRLARRLRAPRPSTWTNHRLEIHRDQIEDDRYRLDIARVLAYKWLVVLDPGQMEMRLMSLMNVETLEYCLDTFRFNDLNASSIGSVVLSRITSALFKKNEMIERRLGCFNERTAVIMGEVAENIARVCQAILAKYRLEALAELSATNAECDAALANHRPEDELRRARRLLAELGTRDANPESSFRLTVNRKLARRKAARMRLARMRRLHKSGFALWIASRLGLVAGSLLVLLQVRVGKSGRTITELISGLLN
ncbi:MAG: hypothetical protein IPM23_01630 [Candidatus Melainabacteria bacterium]|nr:hypothetical protein [Candidatus Melainabacteria bacterium]